MAITVLYGVSIPLSVLFFDQAFPPNQETLFGFLAFLNLLWGAFLLMQVGFVVWALRCYLNQSPAGLRRE